MNIGNRIKQIRKNKGLTQAAVADGAGVTAASLSRWENGEREPTFRDVERVAAALGVTMAEVAREPQKGTGFRKIIEGKLYDTGKCELIYEFRKLYQDPVMFSEHLVHNSWETAQYLKTPKGTYLYFCQKRNDLKIVSENDVKQTVRQLNADEYIRLFGEVEEG